MVVELGLWESSSCGRERRGIGTSTQSLDSRKHQYLCQVSGIDSP